MMKKFILFMLLLLFLSMYPNPVCGEPFAFTVSVGAWTFDSFKSAGGGFLTGFIFPIDDGRGLYGRTQYHQFSIGDISLLQSIELSLMMYYSLGKEYNIFFHVGGEEFLSGAEGREFVGGFGGDKTIWTIGREGFKTSNLFKLFLDISFVNNEFESTGQDFKAFLGLAFHPAQQ